MKNVTKIAVVVLLVTACSGPGPKPPKGFDGILPLGEAILKGDDGSELRISPDGTINSSDDSSTWRLTADGDVRTAEGKVILRLNKATGKLAILLDTLEMEGLVIRPDGAAVYRDKVLMEFDVNGRVVGPLADCRNRQVATGHPSGRRALMMLLSIPMSAQASISTLTMSGHQDKPCPGSESPLFTAVKSSPPFVDMPVSKLDLVAESATRAVKLACDGSVKTGVHGTLKDRSSAPTFGVTIGFSSSSEPQTVVSNEQGCYSVELLPGIYVVTMYFGDAEPAVRRVTVVKGKFVTVDAITTTTTQ